MSLKRDDESMEVIVIDDSDAEDGTGATGIEAGANVSAIMTIMNISDAEYAKNLLSQFQNDLQRTISHMLENTQKKPSETRFLKSDSTKRSLFSGSSSLSTDETLGGHSKPKNHRLIQKNNSAAVPTTSADDPQTSQPQKLSDQWQRSHDNADRSCQADGLSFFVDSDFPPLRSSLDGRQTIQSHVSSSPVPKCHCGLPAAAKVVQRDGQNYGKFYLSCGQDRPGVRKRRARVVAQKSSPEQKITNPYAKASSKPSSPSSPAQRTKCDFFQWDKDGSRGAQILGCTSRYSTLSWQHFGVENHCSLYQKQPAPDQVRQGGVGNCWFLSALSVVAEKPYLIHRIVPHHELNQVGCYQINLCLDGEWKPVLVDSHFPVVIEDLTESSSKKRRRGGISSSPPGRQTQEIRLRGGVPFAKAGSKLENGDMTPTSLFWSQKDNSLIAFPAFCAAPNLQIWPALVEKAYAKVHGCYAQLSGGFIAEGLQDLTGAPTETIVFSAANEQSKKDALWASLRAFAREGFLMGVATAGGGDGLVGGHAYSVLDIFQVEDSILGEQSKVTDFFKKPEDNSAGCESMQRKLAGRERTTVRLVRIRNPWGKREWKGDFSADSERWTNALRRKLGSSDTFAKGDGTFFMTFCDLMERFHHMDVAKTRKGWKQRSSNGIFLCSSGPMATSEYVYHLKPTKMTQAFITVIQPKKRSNTQSKYWYCDSSFVILKRSSLEGGWSCAACVVSGVGRQNTYEILLDPQNLYCCLPFSCLAAKGDVEFEFRLTCYSAEEVLIVRENATSSIRETSTRLVHKELLSRDRKLCRPVASHSILVCIHCKGCLAFVAINEGNDYYLSIKLTVKVQDGLIPVLGDPDETYDIPPRTQKCLLIVASDGRISPATQLSFRYMSSTVPVKGPHSPSSKRRYPLDLGELDEVNMYGSLLTNGIAPGDILERSDETIDTYHWIPQLGSAI